MKNEAKLYSMLNELTLKVCEKMQEKKRDVFNIAERRGGTLNVDDDEDEKPKVDWKQTR
jgi:hypothetical protein